MKCPALLWGQGLKNSPCIENVFWFYLVSPSQLACSLLRVYGADKIVCHFTLGIFSCTQLFREGGETMKRLSKQLCVVLHVTLQQVTADFFKWPQFGFLKILPICFLSCVNISLVLPTPSLCNVCMDIWMIKFGI